MSLSDAGVRAAVRRTLRQSWSHWDVLAAFVEAQRRCRLEEAVAEMADVEGTRQMGEHRAQPSPVGDSARERLKLLLHTIILGRKPGGGRTGHALATTMRLVLGDDIVELAERALLLDLLSEARCRGASIAVEHGDGSMLVLDLAGDRAKRAIGNIPRERASELPGAEGPGLSINCWDHRFAFSAIALVEVSAESIDLLDDAGNAPAGGSAATIERKPKIVLVALLPMLCGQMFCGDDGAIDGLDG